MPNSPELLHGLILSLGQDLPSDLSLDIISFLVFLPLKVDLGKSVPLQFRKSLKSIQSRQCPEQKYLFLKDISPNDIEIMTNSIQKSRLIVYFL